MSAIGETSNDDEFRAPGDFGEDDSVAALIKAVARSIVQEVDRRLAVHGITHAQWVPLMPLAQGRGASIVELARLGASDPGAMTRTIDRLESKGLLERVRSNKDRRMVRLQVTAAGKAVATVVPGVIAEVLNGHLAGFTTSEWRCLLRFLRRMLANGAQARID